jgi:peptidyl-prolyl cis-trans isomerase C
MFSTSRVLPVVLAALLASGVVGGSAQAQEAAPAQAAPAAPLAPESKPDPETVIAKVGTATVTERELEIAQEAFASELANLPQAQWRGVLVDAVVNMKLLALAAEDGGLGAGPAFDAQLAFLKLQALRNLYVEQVIKSGVTDEELQKGYQDLVVSQHKPAAQVRARHILVDTKEEADKIIAELKNGASFEELAKQSKDPSGQNGGDLGFFGEGQMVPEFEKAAFALEPGQVTPEPVQSQFGWHVIKVEEKRMSAPPAIAEVETQLRSFLIRQKFETVLASLRDKFPVEILDPTAAPPETPAPAPEAPKP